MSLSAPLPFKCEEEIKDSFPPEIRKYWKQTILTEYLSLCLRPLLPHLVSWPAPGSQSFVIFSLTQSDTLEFFKESCIGLMGCNYYNKMLKIDFCAFFYGNKDNSSSIYRIKQEPNPKRKKCKNVTYFFSY